MGTYLLRCIAQTLRYTKTELKLETIQLPWTPGQKIDGE